MIRSAARHLGENEPITFEPCPIVARGTPVLTMGSCFAVEVRRALRDFGCCVLPDAASLAEELDGVLTYISGRGFTPLTPELLDRYVMQWYFTATIRQEFERALEFRKHVEDDVWYAREIWQDPYHRALFSRDPARLLKFLAKLDRVLLDSIERAEVFILTLGLIEAWQRTDNSLFVAEAPGRRPEDRGRRETEFRLLTHRECLDDLQRICRLVFSRWPRRHVVLTVSPVPLARTFTSRDHFIANTHSKATLRSVAGEMTALFPNVHYFHSFELCASRPAEEVFLDDGRHVRPEMVDFIVSTFLKQFGDVEFASSCENSTAAMGAQAVD